MKHLLLISALLIAPAAMADTVRYETPEYSGQTPRFDREIDRHRDNEHARRASERRLQGIQRDQRNDLAVDRQHAVRGQRVQDEMVRRQDDAIRANQRYILKTNE